MRIFDLTFQRAVCRSTSPGQHSGWGVDDAPRCFPPPSRAGVETGRLAEPLQKCVAARLRYAPPSPACQLERQSTNMPIEHLSCWALFVLALPFMTSPARILVGFTIFTICYVLFIINVARS